MYKKFKKAISNFLVFVFIFTSAFSTNYGIKVFASDTTNNRLIDVWDFGGVSAGVSSLYNNNITVDGLNKLPSSIFKADSKGNANALSGSTITFGDLSVVPNATDRLYYSGTYNYGSWGNSSTTYSVDKYVSNGCYYCNGSTGGAAGTTRYITINNVIAGDKISVYGGLSNSVTGGTAITEQIHLLYTSTDGNKQDTAVTFSTTVSRVDFVAKCSGSYKIYVEAQHSGKPYLHRIVRTPGVKITGSVNLNGKNISSGYSLNFVNSATGDITVVNTKADNTYDAVLAPDYSYTVTLKDITAYTISDETKVVKIETSDISSGKQIPAFDVIDNNLATVSGNIKGFDSGYDVSKLKITLNPPAGSLSSAVNATVDTKAMTYSAKVQEGVQYTANISEVNDYEITAGGSFNINVNTSQDITVSKKAVYSVNGSFLKLSSTAQIKSIKFINVADGYIYNGSVANGGYNANLRNGAYSIQTECTENYSTITHVVVNGQNTTKDILFDPTVIDGNQQLAWVSDLYVGDSSKQNNYNTVKDALDAAAKMNPASEAQRITIHIAPGIYRAQLKIKTPYITLVNSDPSKQVKITWYYGFGYNYYSVGSDGFYNADLAFDKYLKGNVSNGVWGGSVYLTSSAKGFKAENIVFENSFNKYVTSEELADGISICNNFPQSVSGSLTERTSSTDVTTKVNTERAAAMIIEADNVEFNNCSFIGSQDTLYTQTSGSNRDYFKNCFIEGNTDYIFGDGNSVFDNCTLNFCGYSDSASAGYITAAKASAAYGYLFRNCTITANSKNKQTAGFFGRPWAQGAKVTFENTKLSSSGIIDPAGWTAMSSNLPQNAHFVEYNTTYNGEAVATGNRTTGTVISDEGSIFNVGTYLGGWIPKYCTDNIKYSLTNVTSNGSSSVTIGQPFTIKVTAVVGFMLPDKITVTGHGKALVKDVAYTYDSLKGIIAIKSATDDMIVNVNGIKSISAAFTSQDIGNVGIAGSVVYDSSKNEFAVSGSGITMPASTSQTDPDGLQFVGLTSKVKGDSTIIAKVNGFNIRQASAPTIGLMVRTSMDPKSNYAASIIKPTASNNGSVASYIPYYEYRDSSQGKGTTISNGGTTTPSVNTAADGSFYIKLAYQGSSLKDGDTTSALYRSYLGTVDASGNIQWTVAKSTSTKCAVSNSYYIGLAVASNDPTQTVTVNFDNVTIENTYDISTSTPVASLDGSGIPTWSGNAVLTPSVSASGDCTLNWNAAYDNFGVAKYNIYEGSNLVGSTNSGNITTFKVTKSIMQGFEPNFDPITKAYTFSVQAVDAAGKVSTDSPTTSSDIISPAWKSGSLNTTKVTQNRVNLSWSGASDNVGVKNYNVYDITDSSNPQLIATVDGSVTSYTAMNLNSSTKYVFKVEAGDSSGNWSSNGPSLSVATTAPIVDTDAPIWTSKQLLVSNIIQTTATLSWSNADDNVGIKNYLIYQGSDTTPIATVSNIQNMYTLTKLTPATSYTFTVQAIDEAGNISTSGPSVNFKTPNRPTWQSKTLNASNNIVVQPNSVGPKYTAVQNDSITLSWSGASDPIGVTGYNILQRGALIASVDGSTSTYTVSGLTVGEFYNFEIEAVDNAGCVSTDGPTVIVNMPSVDKTLLPPDNLSVPVLAYDDTSVTLVWTKPSNYTIAGITDYNIYMDGKKVGNANDNKASVSKDYFDSFYKDSSNNSAVKVSNHSYTVTELTPNTTHSFTVRSVDSTGNESTDSNTVTITTASTPQVFNVLDYGAVGDGKAIDTKAIQKAIDSCTAGGKVLFPEGRIFKSGTIWIKSNITLEVDGTLLGSENAEDYPYPDTSFKTVVKTNSLISTRDSDSNLQNIRIIGKGTIDGNGWKQQDKLDADGFQNSLESNISSVGINGILAAAQFNLAKSKGFTDEQAYSTRSNLITIKGATNVYLGGGLSLVNPSQHTISMGSNNVTLDRIKIMTYDCNNGDGIDMSGSGLTVVNSVFDTGDDDINFAAGVGAAAEQGSPVQNIWIYNNYFHRGHGAVVAGSNTAAWIQNILAEDNVMNGIGVGLRCKTGKGIGGGARNIVFRDSAMKNIKDGDQYPFEFTSAYPSTTSDPAPDMGQFKHIFVGNVTVDTSNKSAIFVSGASDAYHEDIHFTNVTFNNTPSASISFMKNSSFNNILYTNVVKGADFWSISNSIGLTFDKNFTGSKITNVDLPDNIIINQGDTAALPSTITIHFDDDTTQVLTVKWNGTIDSNKVGEQTIQGIVEGYNVNVSIKVTVNPVTSIPKDDPTKGTDSTDVKPPTNGESESKQTLNIDIKSNSIVKKEVFDAIKGTDKVVTFTGNNVSWTFNGRDITSSVVSDIDLSLKIVSADLKAKEAAKIKSVVGRDVPMISFSYNYDGPLPGTASVRVFISKDWANKLVNVCRYYADKNTYEIIQSNVKIDADGFVTYTTNHCSDYFVIDTATVSELPKTGSMIDTPALMIIGIFTMCIGIIISSRSRRRKASIN